MYTSQCYSCSLFYLVDFRSPLQDLFSFNEGTECDTHALLGCPCDGGGGEREGQSPLAPTLVKSCQLETKASTGQVVCVCARVHARVRVSVNACTCLCVCTSNMHSCESGYEFVFMHACTCVTGHERVYVCVIFMINHKCCKYFEMQTL